MRGASRSQTELLELLQQTQNTTTNIYRILDLEDREKRLTRFLTWLLDPNESHDADTTFLNAFLDCYGIELTNGGDSHLEYIEFLESEDGVSSDRNEIDLLIETDMKVIGVEIKTTHTEHQAKFEAEKAALEKRAEKNGQEEVEILYLPHHESELINAEYAEHVETWRTVLDALKEHRGELPTLHEIALFDDFTTTIHENVIDGALSFSAQAELYMKYHDKIDENDLDVEAGSFKSTRKNILNHLWEWFNNEYGAWDGQFDRSQRFDHRTKHVSLFKDEWYLGKKSGNKPNLRMEIQATENRLTWSDDFGDDAEYRPQRPHFEMSVILEENERGELRPQYLDYLDEKEHDALDSAGFNRVKDRLNDANADTLYNRFHVFSKIIPVDFDQSDETVQELKEGLKVFVELEDATDQFAVSSHKGE
jgi:hypothetical protein